MQSRLERALAVMFAVVMTAITGFIMIGWPASYVPPPRDQPSVLARMDTGVRQSDTAPVPTSPEQAPSTEAARDRPPRGGSANVVAMTEHYLPQFDWSSIPVEPQPPSF